MGKYEYEALPGTDQVRLLRLNASPDHTNPLSGAFEVTTLKDAPTFEAISYVWGEHPFSESIHIDDNIKDIAITPHLASALKVFRNKDTVRLLWVDGICIDQGNDAEKAVQVSMMAEIYRAATGVLAWMGTGDEKKEDAFVMMQQLVEHDELQKVTEGLNKLDVVQHDDSASSTKALTIKQRATRRIKHLLRPHHRLGTSSSKLAATTTDPTATATPPETTMAKSSGPSTTASSELPSTTQDILDPDIEVWTYIDCILTDRWLTRLWIVQEAILARNLRLFYGGHDMKWDKFAKGLNLSLEKKPRNIRLSADAMDGIRYINHLHDARSDYSMQFGARQNLHRLNMNDWVSSSPGMFPPGLLDILGDLGEHQQIIMNQNRGSHFSSMFWSLKSRNCKDDRDRVYAMLGFLPWDVNINIKPNYTYSTKRVFTEFARAMYERHYIELLVYAGLWDRLPADETQKDDECPSWVPELRPAKLRSGIMNAWDHTMLDYVIKNIEQPRIEWVSFYKIKIEGVIFDKIDSCIAVQGIETNEGLIHALRYYYKLVLELAGENPDLDAVFEKFSKLLAVTAYPEIGEDGRDDKEDEARLAGLLVANMQILLQRFEGGQQRYFAGTISAEEEADLGKIFDLTMFLRKRLTHRTFFITEKKECGLAPAMARPGDAFVRFMGQGVECLIRQVEESEDWQLIGPCYYHAIAEWNTRPRMIALV